MDVKTGRHPISPFIYGINLINNTDFAKEIKLPVSRYGGNAVTRYNWKTNVYNTANDFYYENADQDPSIGSSDQFTERCQKAGVKTIMQISMIGWMPKDKGSCGFNIKKYGEQQVTCTWCPGPFHDCGNGLKKDGKTPITGNDPYDTSFQVDVKWAEEYVRHVVGKYGKASKDGILFYDLDNELDLWDESQRDVRNYPVDTDEVIRLSEQYSAAIKNIDPDAKIMGPVGWSYYSILKSG